MRATYSQAYCRWGTQIDFWQEIAPQIAKNVTLPQHLSLFCRLEAENA
jgi:hypothetical protein